MYFEALNLKFKVLRDNGMTKLHSLFYTVCKMAIWQEEWACMVSTIIYFQFSKTLKQSPHIYTHLYSGTSSDPHSNPCKSTVCMPWISIFQQKLDILVKTEVTSFCNLHSLLSLCMSMPLLSWKMYNYYILHRNI